MIILDLAVDSRLIGRKLVERRRSSSRNFSRKDKDPSHLDVLWPSQFPCDSQHMDLLLSETKGLVPLLLLSGAPRHGGCTQHGRARASLLGLAFPAHRDSPAAF